MHDPRDRSGKKEAGVSIYCIFLQTNHAMGLERFPQGLVRPLVGSQVTACRHLGTAMCTKMALRRFLEPKLF